MYTDVKLDGVLNFSGVKHCLKLEINNSHSVTYHSTTILQYTWKSHQNV